MNVFSSVSSRVNARPWLFGAILVALSGCSSLAPAPEVDPVPARTQDLLPEPLSQRLTSAPTGQAYEVSDSPWGHYVTIHMLAPYQAASGRVCRALVITTDHGDMPGLACRQPGSAAWEAVRPITQMLSQENMGE